MRFKGLLKIWYYLGAGGMPSKSKLPNNLLSAAISLSP